jgi:hypothetical protein
MSAARKYIIQAWEGATLKLRAHAATQSEAMSYIVHSEACGYDSVGVGEVDVDGAAKLVYYWVNPQSNEV